MGPNLMLSWLMILNFRVKIAKLTPFGQPRTAKWALGGPQERSKRAKMGRQGIFPREQQTRPDQWGVIARSHMYWILKDQYALHAMPAMSVG